jgi:subfamily B ATP-binding cassette protein MsbA
LSKFKDINVHSFSNRHLVRRSWSYFYPHLWKVVTASICALIVSACVGGTAYLLKEVTEVILVQVNTADPGAVASARSALILVVFEFVGLFLVKGVARFLQTYYMNTTMLEVGRTLCNLSYAKVILLPMAFFEKNRLGVLMSRVNGDPGGVGKIGQNMVMIFREVLTILGLIGWVIYLDQNLSIWALVVLPLAIWPFNYFGKKLRRIGRDARGQAAILNSQMHESLSGIRVVKAFGNEAREREHFRKENRLQVQISLRGVLYNELSSRVMELVGAIGGGLVLWYGGQRILSGGLSAPELMSFFGALIMLYDPMKKIQASWIELQSGLASAERVFDLLDSPEIIPEQSGDERMDKDFRELEIKGLTFTYPGSPVPAIDGLDLTVRTGERVAIVGPSGGGKTTLVNLLPRFYDAQAGFIRINGTELKDYDLRSLRLSMGMVSQDTFLFNLSVRENIGYVEGDHTQEEIERAAKAAYAHDFILDLPKGYDTVVGERGTKLSGGQKQRITIARALLKNPPLLILDEATSALDTESERIVQKALDNLMADRTSIVIAHRLSTILGADVILVMDKGRVVARGRHAELLESCPLYKKLYEMQFEGQE